MYRVWKWVRCFPLIYISHFFIFLNQAYPPFSNISYPLEQLHRHQDCQVLCSLDDYIMGIRDISLTLSSPSLTNRHLYDCLHFFFLLRFSLRVLEHLKVTTRLASSIRPFPVWGFLPLRIFLSLTQNFPNPETRRSSPDSRVCLMISRRDSTADVDSCFRRSDCL